MKNDTHKRRLIRKAWELYKAEGFAAAGNRAAVRFKDLLVRSNAAVWFAKELGHSPPPERAPVPGSFSRVAPQVLAEWLWRRRGLSWAADPRELEIASPLEHPWTCWRLANEIVAFCKLGGGRVFIEDFERAVSLPKGLVFLSDIYVLSEARRKGIGRALLVATMNSLKQQSFSVLSCHIPATNHASAGLFGSLGFRSYGRVQFLRILGLPMFSIKPEQMLGKMAIAEHDARSGLAGP